MNGNSIHFCPDSQATDHAKACLVEALHVQLRLNAVQWEKALLSLNGAKETETAVPTSRLIVGVATV